MPLTGQSQQRGPPPNYENQQIPLSRSSQPGNVPPDVITPSPRGTCSSLNLSSQPKTPFPADK